MSDSTEVNYVASPTLAKFHASNAKVRGIIGPIGSGKSVGLCIEILHRAQQQAPSTDGVRRTRWAMIRNTYGELKSTTIKTWQEWVPQEICPIVYDTPIRGRMRCELGDGTKMDMEVFFISMDKPQDAGKVLSLELTGAFINEARELPIEVIRAAYSRTGRYPSKRTTPDGITWSGLIMDTNPPDTDHWWYKIAEQGDEELQKSVKFEEDGAESVTQEVDCSWEFFRQPGGLIQEVDGQGNVTGYRANQEAENIDNLPEGYGYYMKNVPNNDPEWVKVHCCGEYGSVFSGKPVYNGVYSDSFHAAKHELGVFRKMPLYLGWDYGLTPACIIGQVTPTGQLRILREYVCERGGIKQFVTDVVRPELSRLFPGMSIISHGDPSGNAGSQADIDLSPESSLRNLGIPTTGAATNDFTPRRQAVIDRLTRTIDGEPALILDPSCDVLRRGFIGGYKFRRIQVSGEEERFKYEPEKNSFSHPHDALQYLILGVDVVKIQELRPKAPPPPNRKWKGFV